MKKPCDECYERRQPHKDICPKCGKETFVTTSAMSIAWECTNCGWGLSGGLYPQACNETTQYSLYIRRPDDTKKLAILAQILNMKILDLNQAFNESDGQVKKSLEIFKCVEQYKTILEHGIECSLDPTLLRSFSRILDCPYIISSL